MLSQAPVPSELPQDTKQLLHPLVGPPHMVTLTHQSVSPFQVWKRRFLYFSREDKQPQFSTQSQISYFSCLSTIKPSPTSPTAAATHAVTEGEEMGFESRKSQGGVWQGKAGRSSPHAGDKKG